jgi:hypothetical protein
VNLMNIFQRWQLRKRLKRLEAQINSESLMGRTCDHCSHSIEKYLEARYCANCERYFCFRCAGLGHGYCPKCQKQCGVNEKVVGWLEERDLVVAELNGSAAPATMVSRDAAKEDAKQWVREKATAKDWESLVACLLPDRFALADDSVERAYLETQQYDAEGNLICALIDREHPIDAAAAGNAVLETYDKHPSNERVAKVAIRLASGSILKPPEPLMSVCMKAGAMVRKFNDAGLYATRKPFGLSDFIQRK